MFRGSCTVSLDSKGRLAIPSRYRDRIAETSGDLLILTLNPLDRCLWLYPQPEWELIEAKLQELSDFDRQSRRTKQMMRGYATETEIDAAGRILLPQKLREFASLTKQVVVLGQGNKFELWDETRWNAERDEWLGGIDAAAEAPTEALRRLSL